MLTNFEVIIWDFDGVIIDSDEIRTNSFKETFKEFGKRNVDKLIEYRGFGKAFPSSTTNDSYMLVFA